MLVKPIIADLLALYLHLRIACASLRLVKSAPEPDSWKAAPGARSSGAPVERICAVLGVNGTELAGLFGVRRQAIDQWASRGVPASRQEKLATVGAIADLLSAKLKADRIPGVVRRPAVAYGGRTALAAIADDDQDLVLAELRDSFDWSSPA